MNYDINKIINILLGLIIGVIIGYIFFKDIKYKGLDSNDVIKEIYTDSDGRKYKWNTKICICPINYSMNKLKDKNFIDDH